MELKYLKTTPFYSSVGDGAFLPLDPNPTHAGLKILKFFVNLPKSFTVPLKKIKFVHFCENFEKSSVGDPDPEVSGYPGFGAISQR
jgi:hypothetical protein